MRGFLSGARVLRRLFIIPVWFVMLGSYVCAYAQSLRLPEPPNVQNVIEYDPDRGMYVFRKRIGDRDIIAPSMMTPKEFDQWWSHRELHRWFQQRNSETVSNPDKPPFQILDMHFGVSPLDRIFGPGGVRLTTQGSLQLSMGLQSNRNGNPALPQKSRRKTFFKFDQKIQANVNVTVGEKLRFNMNYNTDATFDFDSKNMKLIYEGHEDEIIKSIEAGNVSMETGSSLIRGGRALFGVKVGMQFGKLTLTGLVSQQNSESRTVSTKGGIQTTSFTLRADQYDGNRHFFLSHYFRDNYDQWCSRLPHVSSGIQITRIEVWVTNKNNRFDESRNLVSFMDLGENTHLGTSYWKPDMTSPLPSNRSNDLLAVMKAEFPGARNINDVTQVLQPLEVVGISGGKDYEKVESARLLREGEYTLNSSLGYISLSAPLSTDEVLAVAFEYTYGGKVYQVGEFSSDVTDTSQSLYVKMLRATTVSPSLPTWHLMMRNVYALGARHLQQQKFRLDIKWLNESDGMEINHLPIAGLSSTPLLQLLGLDRIDSNQSSGADGFFDYIEGYTVQSSNGRIIFPVVEPFGSALSTKIGDAGIATRYVYQELYDSTLTVARQFADKNKFMLTGEYQASGGAVIRLNSMNVPRGSVIVTAGGMTLTENSDYTVDYSLGVVTITNQGIIDSGTEVSVTLENQSLFSMQRRTLMGLDAQYRFNKDLNIGATLLNYSEKALTEKVTIGQETVNNTMLGFNLNFNKTLPWVNTLLNRIPTVNAEAPSVFRVTGEVARIIPKNQKTNSTKGSSYIDDFESAQSGIDMRNPYSWTLASTPRGDKGNELFPEASLTNNVAYGINRALLAWNYIDRIWTQKNSSMLPGYLRNDLKQLSNPYVREVTVREIYPGRDLDYGSADYIQTLNVSFYPNERGPYNLDCENIDSEGRLLFPERRWGGIMRKLDNTDFQSTNVEYLQFWLLDPFLDPENPNRDGGDLYFNFGEISEDILKDGMKSYENGMPVDGDSSFLTETKWGKVSTQNSLSYAFANTENSRLLQDVGLDGLSNREEYSFPTYSDYLTVYRSKLSPTALARQEEEPWSALNDPAGDNYHFYRSPYYDQTQASILERYKRYNGVEGNSLASGESDNPQYQSSRTVPDVEDINQDNTLNEYERYFQYRVSIRPEDLRVGYNHIADKRETVVTTREGPATTVWYLFKIPLSQPDAAIGGISDFSTVRFARMFMTGFRAVTHLRFASLELVRGEWREYDFALRGEPGIAPDGTLDVSVVNIEENSGREPVNYVLPPDVTRIQDPGQIQATQLNEQSLSMTVRNLPSGGARAIYKDTRLDLRTYRRLQMWIHGEATVDDPTHLEVGDLAVFVRLGSDVTSNYYEYELPLDLTAPGLYNNLSLSDREAVWPRSNLLDIPLDRLTALKTARHREESLLGGSVSLRPFSMTDPDDEKRILTILGNPSLSDVRVMLIGIRNKSSDVKDGTVWLNELRVTDFRDDGGWAAKVNANLGFSDIANINFGFHHESAGFGMIDQNVSQRRLDSYQLSNITVQADPGRLAPSKLSLTMPLYYSRSNERTTPLYNPLDPDIMLKEALKVATDRSEKDSIRSYALTRRTSENFSLSGLRFNIRHTRPKIWDPANFQASFSFSRQNYFDPTVDHQVTYNWRGSFQYSWSPVIKPIRPFGSNRNRNKTGRFLRDWGINWLFSNITLSSDMMRHYYEQQTRGLSGANTQLPLEVSKNFLWNRQLTLTWNPLKSMTISFSGNTTARIEETLGAVNKRLFPDRYRNWRDTVWSSIKSLGTPWNYNQTFTGSYRTPFSQLPALDWINGTLTYTSIYRWDRGATVDEVSVGNSVYNQSVWNGEGRFNLETLYNKWGFLRRVNTRFSGSSRQGRERPRLSARKFERAVTLNPDSGLILHHPLKTRSVRVTATSKGKPYPLEAEIADENTVKILSRGQEGIIVTVMEIERRDSQSWKNEVRDHIARLLMSVRGISVRWRGTHSLLLPQFMPEVGDVLGQSLRFGPMSPGLDFAFGFYGEDYIGKALKNGWLMTDPEMVSPAIWNHGKEMNIEFTLEPIRGLKIILSNNLTDNRTAQKQFQFTDMPTVIGGAYVRTHVALASALRSSRASDGFRSAAFDKFLVNIPIVAERIEQCYANAFYPSDGFMEGHPLAGQPYDPTEGGVSMTSPDVLIPAFLAAYSGQDVNKINLSAFGGWSSVRPNWRITYDGLIRVGNLKSLFKSVVLSHTYQCTYSVGHYTNHIGWQNSSGTPGFIMNETTGNPEPSSPYAISSVAVTERFAPLIGVNMTFRNNLSVNAEWRDTRTLTLNTAAGQLVETSSSQLSVGGGIRIPEFNKIIRFGGANSKEGSANDLTVNLDVAVSNNQALIRRIENAYSQATRGSRTFSINFMASYQLSRKITVSAFWDHQVNTPLVSNNSYPTTNSNYGISFNVSLAR